MSTMSLLVFALVVLLSIQVYLLWSALKWLKLIGDILGCNPYRTRHIARLMKRLGYDRPIVEIMGIPSKLSKEKQNELDEELQGLFEAEMKGSPAKVWQLTQLTEKMEALMKLLESRLTPP